MNIFCKISLCITLCDHAGTRYNTCKTSDVNVALLFSRSPSVIALFANQEYECVCVCTRVGVNCPYLDPSCELNAL